VVQQGGEAAGAPPWPRVSGGWGRRGGPAEAGGGEEAQARGEVEASAAGVARGRWWGEGLRGSLDPIPNYCSH
jgi:hypothetical protein